MFAKDLPNQSPWGGGAHDIPAEAEDILSQLTSIPVLSVSEERELTTELKRQRALMVEYESMLRETDDHEQYTELGRARLDAQQAYDRISNKLFEANVRWVLKLVNKSNRLEFMDRFQWACLGLWRAIHLYDPDYLVDGLPVRLSTYATYWIRQHMQRGADSDERLIRLPSHANETLRMLSTARTTFQDEFGRLPHDIGELCQYAGVDEGRIVTLINIADAPLSLDATYENSEGVTDGESTLLDIIPDPNTDIEAHFIERASRERVAAAVREALGTLEHYTYFDERKQRTIKPFVRHAAAIRLRFRIGEPVLSGQEPTRTMDEVGKLLKPAVTRERVRQLQRAGIRWMVLNNPELRSYFDGTWED